MTKHIETAPERIYLQISDTDVDAAFPFPENTDDVTWCADSVVAVEVKYIRADLAEKQRDALLAALTEIAELDILKYHHAYAIAKGAIEEIEALKCSNS
jgi:hypothetical protein